MWSALREWLVSGLVLLRQDHAPHRSAFLPSRCSTAATGWRWWCPTWCASRTYAIVQDAVARAVRQGAPDAFFFFMRENPGKGALSVVAAVKALDILGFEMDDGRLWELLITVGTGVGGGCVGVGLYFCLNGGRLEVSHEKKDSFTCYLASPFHQVFPSVVLVPLLSSRPSFAPALPAGWMPVPASRAHGVVLGRVPSSGAACRVVLSHVP